MILNVAGTFFEPTHKYLSSAAMGLDSADGWDDQTGEVDWCHAISVFYDMDTKFAYDIVSNYIEQEVNSCDCNPPTWQEAKQMIDILVEGRNWLTYHDSNGFVAAQCIESQADAKAEFDEQNRVYVDWLTASEDDC